MMTITSRAALAALVSLFLAGPALAQSAAPAAKSDTAAPADTKMGKQRSPESMECSKEADAKGLKGKERKKFRKECMKDAKKSAADKPKS